MRKLLLIGSALGALMVAAGPALAQTQAGAATAAPTGATAAGGSTGPAASAGEASALSEVVVTAQRREQSAQTVGIALSVLSGETLARRGVDTLTGLQTTTPSLQVTPQFGSGQPTYTLRGVGFRDYATNNTPAVGIYVDEVAYTFPVMTQGVLFDVDRIEVLRGPQGTLYGRNSTGGAINVLSRKPTSSFSSGVGAEIGSYGLFSATGYVSGPITDRLKARLSATTEQGGGWQRNRETGQELGDLDRSAVRLLLDYAVTDRLSLELNLHAYLDHSDGLGLQLFRDSPIVGPAKAHTGQRDTSWGMSPDFAKITGLTVNQKPFKDNEGWGTDLRANYHFDFADLTYIGSFERFNRKEYDDFDAVTAGGAGVYFTSDIAVQSHELRLRSNAPGPLKWIGGVYFSDEHLDELYQSDFATTFGPIFQPIFNPPAGTPFGVRTPYRQEATSEAVFAQAEYQLTPKINLIGGLRFEHEERRLCNLGTFVSYFPALNFANNATDGSLASRDLDTNEVTGKAAVEYAMQPGQLLYASYSRGVKSGGFTAYNTLNPRGIDPFQPEKLDAYEVGFKLDLFDRTLRLNGAAYFYDYHDQQIQSAIYDPLSSAVVGKIVNAPKTRIVGGEIEAVWRPVRDLTVTQALGYSEGEFETFLDLNTAAPPATINRSGQDIGTPHLTYSGEVAYDWHFDPRFALRGSVNYSYRDTESFPLLGPAYTVADYWLVNFDLALHSPSGRWEVAVFGRNILDQRYDLTRNSFLVGFNNDVSAPGRVATYGVRVGYHY